MDLRSIINTDTSTAAKSSRSAQAYEASGTASPVRSAPRGYESPSPGRGSYQARPAPPPPLQPPAPSDFRSTSGSSSFQSSHSPYQYTSPSSSLSGGPYPHTLHSPGYNPSHIQHPDATPTKEKPVPSLAVGYIAQVTHGPQPVQSPIAIENSHSFDQQYNAHPHTSPTLSSGRGPTPSTYHNNSTSAFQSQPYSHRHPYPHQSQPSTPIGPPPAYPQPAPAYRPEATTAYRSPTGPSSDSYSTFAREPSYPSMPKATRTDTQDTHSSDRGDSFHGVDEGSEREYLAERQRERSLSVSPKTKIPSQPRPDSAYADRWSGQVTPAKRKQVHETERGSEAPSQLLTTPTAQEPVNGARDPQPQTVHPPDQTSSLSNGSRRQYFDPVQPKEQEKDITMLSPSEPSSVAPIAHSGELSPGNAKDHEVSRSPSHAETNQQSSTPHSLSGRQSPTSGPSPNNAVPPSSHLSPPPQPIAAANRRSSVPKHEPPVTSPAGAGASVSPKPPTRKRPRYDEPPIYARKANRSTSSSPVVTNRRHLAMGVGPTGAAPAKHDNKQLRPLATQIADPSNVTKDANGLFPSEASIVALPQAQPVILDNGPLGPWEPSITNVIPYEEITRVIMDFLFLEVVERKDIGTNAAGIDPVQGAQLEVEAKLGQLVDKNTNERVRLPILTECVFNKDDSNYRTAFKSSMTEAQHRTLNQFLNKAVLSSKQPAGPSPSQAHANEVGASSKPRIPLDYVHTRERDRFYDLPQSQLPSIPLSIRPYINPRHRLRVRVTTDQKTGEKLAQIIKVRIADLDIYSPRTAFDWRLSVNLEMTYDGDVSNLTEVIENGRKSERNKDRMTYKHLAYQIDLTQVTMQSDANSKAEREHELEIEVSAAKVQEQGRLAKEGQTSQYEDLVKGFVDNVRTLARVISRAEGH